MSESEQDDTPEAREEAAEPADPERRRTLGSLVMAGSAAYACALAVPSLAFISSEAATEKRTGFTRLVRLDTLPEGEAVRVTISRDQRDAFTITRNQILGSVWLRRKGEEVLALTSECPHLGCAISARGKGFTCPCHTSSFDAGGKAQSGPSPRNMDSLAARVTDGWVEVEFKRFRQGKSDKVELA